MTVSAIAPGWWIVGLLALLAIALFFVFALGDEHQETLRSMDLGDGGGSGEGHVTPRAAPYDQERDFLDPNERCTSCGLEIEQHHDACHDHRYCLKACPQCGGDLEPIQES